MKTFYSPSFFLFGMVFCCGMEAKERVYEAARYGLKADSKRNAAPMVCKLLDKIKGGVSVKRCVVLRFSPGRYHFHEEGRRCANITSLTTTRRIRRVGLAL